MSTVENFVKLVSVSVSVLRQLILSLHIESKLFVLPVSSVADSLKPFLPQHHSSGLQSSWSGWTVDISLKGTS